MPGTIADHRRPFYKHCRRRGCRPNPGGRRDATAKLRSCPSAGGIDTSCWQLTAGKPQEFAVAGRFEEMVAALSIMSNVPTAAIEQNMRDAQAEALLVFAKAIGLSWETTRSIMMLAARRYRRSTTSVDQAMPAFHRLRQSTAQQILDFHRMSGRSARPN